MSKIGPETVLAEYIVSQQELLQTFEKSVKTQYILIEDKYVKDL